MNKCLNCSNDVKNKYCSVSCQNSHQNKSKHDKKFGKMIHFLVECFVCSKKFSITERENLHPQKEKYYCSNRCSMSRYDNKGETKEVYCQKCGSIFLANKRSSSKICCVQNQRKFECKMCNKEFFDKKKRTFCSRSCQSTFWCKNNRDVLVKAGLKSSNIQSQLRRSKNEIAFANLCINKFTKVLTNEPFFNGWDADIIIEDLKVAILWNGVWHYKKITEKHSLLQIQNRDSIKIDEIVKSGYIPYVIKDMGKFSMEKVEGEWLKFNEWIKSFKF